MPAAERRRAKFETEYERWKTRPLDDRQRVYAWADGINVRARLEQEKPALLVVIGATRDVHKEVLAVVSPATASRPTPGAGCFGICAIAA
jgi:transposase-like protein